MKTTILTSLLIAVTLLTANAQTNVKIIGKAGLNFTNLNEKDGEGRKEEIATPARPNPA